MEVRPYNEFERVYNVGVIIGSLVIFSAFVSTITNLVLKLRSLNAAKAQQETMIRRYMAEHKVSNEMSARVWHCVRKMQITASRKVALKDMPGLSLLPVHVKADLRQEIFRPVLMEHPFFDWLDYKGSGVVGQLCKKVIEERSFDAGEEVFTDGEEVDCMFFVTGGQIDYYEADAPNGDEDMTVTGVSPSASVAPGDWACEIVLWAQNIPKLPGVFYTNCVSNMLAISGKDFQNTCKRVEPRRVLRKYAELFVIGFNRAGTEVGTEVSDNILFNGTGLVLNLMSQATTSAPGAIMKRAPPRRGSHGRRVST